MTCRGFSSSGVKKSFRKSVLLTVKIFTVISLPLKRMPLRVSVIMSCWILGSMILGRMGRPCW